MKGKGGFLLTLNLILLVIAGLFLIGYAAWFISTAATFLTTLGWFKFPFIALVGWLIWKQRHIILRFIRL